MIIKAIILGIIEGLTEFLPVSSTGHLVLANNYLNFEGEFGNLFAVVIQIGAILSVLIYFKDKLFPKIKGEREFREYMSLWMKVVVGTIPAGILGVLFEDKIEDLLFHPTPIAIALIVGAFLLIWAERHQKVALVTTESEITYKQAFMIGCAQCMALIPGMSRSASTIIGGLLSGLSRKIAAEFSFFLAIPVIFGAGFLKLVKSGLDFTSEEWTALGVGTVVSFVVAYFVIAAFMGYIKTRKLAPFAYYRIILGAIILMGIGA